MTDQGYYNNQTDYPMQQGYGRPAYGQPAYGRQGYGQYPPQQVVPVQNQPRVVVIKEKRTEDGTLAGCCAGICAACLACLCCCCLAAAGGPGPRHHRGRF